MSKLKTNSKIKKGRKGKKIKKQRRLIKAVTLKSKGAKVKISNSSKIFSEPKRKIFSESKIKIFSEPKIKIFSEPKIKIKVVGVGGAGGNVITRMHAKKINGVELVAINTDIQGLKHNRADKKICIGKNTTRGLGAGMDPELGRSAAEEDREEIENQLKGTDLLFLACGLGGGTGSGASPIVAETAKRLGSLVIAVVTKPFNFEGAKRAQIAEEAWQRLVEKVDAIVTIPNERIFNLIDKDTSILKAFSLIDDILRQGVEGICDLLTYPGIINLDYANIKSIMEGAGPALMGIGKSRGPDRAIKAAKRAIQSPLLDISIDGATRVLFNISGQEDMSLAEIHEAARVITDSIDKEAKVIFGAVYDKNLKKGEIKTTVIAGGFEKNLTDNFLTKLPLEVKTINYEVPVKIAREDETDEKEMEIPSFLKKKKK